MEYIVHVHKHNMRFLSSLTLQMISNYGMLCRHHTVSAEMRSLTLKLFVAQFVNTALSSLVANMYIPALYNRLQDTFLGTLILQVHAHPLYSSDDNP